MIELYKKVFNEDGTQKLSGREACKELIKACQDACYQDIDFGNEETGMMNVENIQRFMCSCV